MIRKGHSAAQQINNQRFGGTRKNLNQDRTGKLTVHPEILDKKGRITDEELLTVRFSSDNEQPPSTSSEETSAE